MSGAEHNTVSNQINAQLQELIGLWADVTPGGLQRISALCDRMAAVAAQGECAGVPHRDYLRRAEILSAKAVARVAECLAIQSRTGSYLTHGGLELSPRIVTSGWEG